MGSCGVVRGIEVLGEDTVSVLRSQDNNRLDGEEGHIGRHCFGGLVKLEVRDRV